MYKRQGRTYEAPGTQGPSATNPNTDDDSRVLIESADLQVVKAVSATPNAGGAISWTITPSNNGPSVSRNTAANPVSYTHLDVYKRQVHLRARVANASANLLSHGNTLYNVATFPYNNGQGAAKVLDASATEQYVDPLPTLTKAVSGTPGANGTVAFTLAAGNTSGRPTLFDSVVYDCLPAGFTIPAPVSYTHLDVYKRQDLGCRGCGGNERIHRARL